MQGTTTVKVKMKHGGVLWADIVEEEHQATTERLAAPSQPPPDFDAMSTEHVDECDRNDVVVQLYPVTADANMSDAGVEDAAVVAEEKNKRKAQPGGGGGGVKKRGRRGKRGGGAGGGEGAAREDSPLNGEKRAHGGRGARERGGRGGLGGRPPRLLPPPDGWSDAPAFGALIGNFILPMKTPLSRGEFCGVGLHHPDEIAETVAYLYPRRPIAGVLDLTSRSGGYYRRSEFGRHGIHVASVPFPPHQVPPSNLIEDALHEVQRMWRQKGPDSIVLVHCTHGLNRTGAFVCAALQRFMGMDAWTAMITFQNARPPGMQHPNLAMNIPPHHACWEGAQDVGKK